ncbi:MAG: insulinase family protein [Bacteroidota bacterium]
MKNFKITFLGFALFFCFIFAGYGQKGIVNPKDTIPADPNVVIGKLANGLTYYIRKNTKPEKRVELRLAVNAGSILENPSQLGLAHFTEHMCFNGTKTFPGNEMVNYLQKYGIAFGADLNAYTSFDETVYMLQIPTDNKELFQKGMQIIEDWAHNVTMDSKEIDKERGVITEEWRLGLGADDRMRKAYFPVIFKDSRYADRLPIGDINVIKNFPYDTLRSFYKQWYRPNLQAVAVVGDVDVKEVEAMIKQMFGGIENPVNAKPRVVYEVPDNKEPLISICSDKEATNSMVLVLYKHKAQSVYTVEDYKHYLEAQLYNEMLAARFKEISDKADSPFIQAGSDYSNFLARTTDAYELFAVPKENMIEKSMEILLNENERVKQFGFTATEFERLKDQMLSDAEQASKEFDKTESSRLVNEYVSNFLRQEPMPGVKIEYKLTKKLLPEIKLEDINALAKKWITDDNIAIVVTAPARDGIKLPTEASIKQIIALSKSVKLLAYVDNFKAEPLVKEQLAGAKVVKKTDNKALGFTELTFGNGVQVVIKKTDFKNDEILISSYALGGTSLVSDKDFVSAFFASSVINESGVGSFDNAQLEKKLKGKVIEINPYMDDLKQGFQGKCAPKDLETLLQLTYLYCKDPRKDTAAYNGFISKMKSQMKFIGSNPVYAFIDTLYKSSTSNSARSVVIPSIKQLNEIDLDVLYKIYTDRFGNAANQKFFIVGNVDVDSITPLLEKYLGSLPGNGKQENWKDNGIKFPAGVTDVSIKKGTDPKSMVGIIFDEKFEWNDKNLLALRMAKEIISIKLIEVIREEMSGVYSPQVQMQVEQYPQAEFSLMIMFGCSPKNTGKLTKACLGIIKAIRDKGPAEIDLNKAKEELLRAREVDSKTNKFWLAKLESLYYDKSDGSMITDFKNKVNAITLKDIQEAATKYLTKEHYLRVVLYPAGKPAKK